MCSRCWWDASQNTNRFVTHTYTHANTHTHRWHEDNAQLFYYSVHSFLFLFFVYVCTTTSRMFSKLPEEKKDQFELMGRVIQSIHTDGLNETHTHTFSHTHNVQIRYSNLKLNYWRYSAVPAEFIEWYWRILNENHNRETSGGKKKILAALGKYGISWLAAGAMSPTGRLLTKRHLSSGSFYSLLLNYWMVRGKNCWYSPVDKNAAVCTMCDAYLLNSLCVHTHQLSVQICNAAAGQICCLFLSLTMTVSDCARALLFLSPTS